MAVILVGMADLKVARGPDSLTTLGLGSCVGVCLQDPQRQVAGMAHIMLPHSGNAPGTRMKFADTGIEDLIREMEKLGALRRAMVAKLAGGAHMFGVQRGNSVLNVGERNAESCVKLLGGYGIPIKAKETGGNCGRTIIFNAATGALTIRMVGRGEYVV